jgi:hypothetical protein
MHRSTAADRCEVSMIIPFDAAEPWSGAGIGSKPNTDVNMMAHIALTSLCENCLAAITALPIVLLLIQNQENPVWHQCLEAVSDLEGPHFHAGMTSLVGTRSTCSTSNTTLLELACSSVCV